MNTKLLFSLCLLTIGPASFAQVPTLSSANIAPSLNDSFLVVAADTSVSPGPSGVGMVWNFGSLATMPIADSVSIANVIYANTAPSYAGLAAAASIIPSTTFSTSTHAAISPASSFTTYYITSASKLSTSALYYSTANSALYTDPMDVFQFPFTYGTAFTDAYAGYVTIGSITGTQSGTVSVNGDAWGTLTLPPAPPSTTPRTYTGVLRVRGYQLFKDSLGLFPGGVIYDTLETYTWYQPGYHSALMTISTLRNTFYNYKTVSYARQQIANHQAVPEVAGVDATLKVYPNPANGYLYISYNTPANERIKVSLVDVLGREVSVISDGEVNGNVTATCNTSALPKGFYIVRIQSAEGMVSRAVELQ